MHFRRNFSLSLESKIFCVVKFTISRMVRRLSAKIGKIKRLAARASSSPSPFENQIMETKQLYGWAKSSLEGIHCSHVTNNDEIDEIEREETLLHSRFASSITIPATQNYHAFHLIADEPARVMLCIFISLNILT